MSHLIDRIFGKEIKDLASVVRACKFNSDSCSLEGKFGFLGLDLSKYQNLAHCKIKIRRTSGNGIIFIDKVYNITSKVGEYINVNITSGKLEITRPESSVGNVDILEVSMYSAAAVMADPGIDVKSSLKQCESKGVRIVNNRVFVSEGSSITAQDGIEYVETSPPNMYKLTDKSVYFVSSSELIKLKVVGIVERDVPDYVRTANTILTPSSIMFEKKPSFDLVKSSSKSDQVGADGVAINKNSVIAYNYDVQPKTNNVVLGRYGEFIVDSILLQPNKSYYFSVNGSVIDGNGRVTVLISNSDLNGKAFYLNGLLRVPFTTKPGRSAYKLIISRGNSSTGSVLIDNISFEEDKLGIIATANLQQGSIQTTPEFEAALAEYAVNEQFLEQIRELRKSKITKKINSWYDYNSPALNNNIKELSEHFSVLDIQKYDAPILNLNGIIGLTDVSSRTWYSRMASNFNSLKYFYNGVAFNKSKNSIGTINTVLSTIEFLPTIPTSRIWLKEIPETRQLSEEEIVALRKYKIIATPSKSDYYKLSELLLGVNIEHKPLPWSYVPGDYQRKNYCLYFEHDEQITRQLIKAWKPTYGKLYVVGSTLDLPVYMEHISQYVPYRDLVKFVVEADNLIYISDNFNHKSGLVDLALHAGVKLITNNHEYLNKGRMIRNNKDGIVSYVDISVGLEKPAAESKPFSFNIDEYNKFILETMKSILGV